MTPSKGSVILLLSIATVMLIITMFKQDDRPITLISVNQVHTYLYTSDLETMPIPLLINKDDTHLLLEEAIDSVFITNDEQSQKIPVKLTDIRKDSIREYNNYQYHEVTLFINPSLKTTALTTHIDDAMLVITYHDFPELILPIGSFSYSFYDNTHSHISVETRINIPKHTDEYPTSMGLYFNINNKTKAPLTITNLSLLTNQVTPNTDHIMELTSPTQDLDALGEHMPKNYNPLDSARDKPLAIELAPNTESFFLMPFTYQDSLGLLHRYPLYIEYTYQGKTYAAVYDDFLFIKTDPFIFPNDTFHNEVIYDDYH